MAKPNTDPAIRLSILERLIDDDPGASVDPPASPRKQLRQLRLAIRRDIQMLLNSRERCMSCPDELTELKTSILEYGMTDISTKVLSSEEDKDLLYQMIQETVARFEPRFKSVRVLPAIDSVPGDRTLRFRIEAVVFADPVPEELVFDSMIEPITRSVEVKA
jgi:type VI secretion system protein ImpF